MLLADTRGGTDRPLIQALAKPASQTHGLYTLKTIPKLDFKAHLNSPYQDLAAHICAALGLGGQILQSALERYNAFNPIAPLRLLKPNLAVLELYHGPTLAFKDMALQPLGAMLGSLAKDNQEKFLILVATSGDTGPATLASLAGLENIKVVCLYPAKGTSLVQALQMQTMDAANLKVYGIEGNFDDAQSALKNLLNDHGFNAQLQEKGFSIGVANSVNFGRVLFQVVYHVWAYLEWVRLKKISYGDLIRVIVPSGNFGNALGAFYAKEMGLPIAKIAIVSNANDVLAEFFNTGVYDISHRVLQKTYAPAMDILKSSNVERLLYALFGNERTKECMQNLDTHKRYMLSPNELATLKEHFEAVSCTDTECLDYIKQVYEDFNHLIDPHTATALKALDALKSPLPSVIVSTAAWAKFPQTTCLALEDKPTKDDQEALEILAKKGITPPSHVKDLLKKIPIHTEVLKVTEIASHIKAWL
ncbi:Threonine synthase ThrC [Helicobacter sp. NHP19-003]|uniref:Threonine synthase n=1 Tax=Helicobacter gastrocanis TaxID=2849641 RepID=A0ABN6I3S2_9HELI|nr:threonine synthase [Helicobacter sp. NHP19-003]BCZ18242.1 Threonine synthase ThrC [Helicobacter sp. NHP19-003]